MCLARGQHRPNGQTDRIATEVDFGAEPAARTAESLGLGPPFSPAAQRCARMMVLSIICSMSRSPPLSASACKITSHTPERHQRRNCRQTEFHLPNWSGRSRHGAPVRQIQSAPSKVRRWFFGGRPDRAVRNATTIAHSPSVIEPRITVDLATGRSASNHAIPRRGNLPERKRNNWNRGAVGASLLSMSSCHAGFFYCGRPDFSEIQGLSTGPSTNDVRCSVFRKDFRGIDVE